MSEVYTDHIILEQGKAKFKIGYKVKGDEVTFDPRAEWKQVELQRKYVEVSNATKRHYNYDRIPDEAKKIFDEAFHDKMREASTGEIANAHAFKMCKEKGWHMMEDGRWAKRDENGKQIGGNYKPKVMKGNTAEDVLAEALGVLGYGVVVVNGGKGSGNWGHKGVKGQLGGSAPSDGESDGEEGDDSPNFDEFSDEALVSELDRYNDIKTKDVDVMEYRNELRKEFFNRELDQDVEWVDDSDNYFDNYDASVGRTNISISRDKSERKLRVSFTKIDSKDRLQVKWSGSEFPPTAQGLRDAKAHAIKMATDLKWDTEKPFKLKKGIRYPTVNSNSADIVIVK